jgi:uncharacterized membrane protein
MVMVVVVVVVVVCVLFVCCDRLQDASHNVDASIPSC